MTSSRRVHVIAGVLRNGRGQVLLAQRRANTHLAGCWEFPGGKLEPGELREAGLCRELHEELGVDVHAARPLIQVSHDYPDKSVLLDVWLVNDFAGEPHGKEGQPLRWVEVERLSEFNLPAADVPVVAALRLPQCYVISPEPTADHTPFLARLETLLARGERLIQLRAKQLPPAALTELATRAWRLCDAVGASLLVNDAPYVAERLPVGIHLSARALMAHDRRPLPATRWIGASCHNAVELAHAARIGIDFAVLGPVQTTLSHPGARALGWTEFGRLAQGANLPVYALGGVGPADVNTAHLHGGQGVAGISAFWPDIKP